MSTEIDRTDGNNGPGIAQLMSRLGADATLPRSPERRFLAGAVVALADEAAKPQLVDTWSPANEAELVALTIAGVGVIRLAHHFGCAASAVYSRTVLLRGQGCFA